LHWADASTLELIHILVEQGATARLLLLYTARPEFRAQWPLRAHHTQIHLNRLSVRDIRTMVQEVAARKALSDETIATVVERTAGVPLFVDELTRTVIESGSLKSSAREIPVTLHDSLMARLDRLGPAKEVAQVGAVIGSEFSYELLHAVHPIAGEDLQRALRSLADAELLYVRGIAPDARYQFKHALIRDAAYEALLKSRRKDLHRLVARTIDSQFPALKETQPEVLARHWTEAGEIELAIAEWSKAGRSAQARNAFSEALESYRQALALLNLLAESSERNLRELELGNPVIQMLSVTKGWAAPETVEASERHALVAEKTGRLQQLIDSLARRGFAAWILGEFSVAGALADQALELALREGNPTSLAYRYMLQLAVRHCRGDLAGTEEYFAAGSAVFDDPAFRRGPLGGCIAVFGWASWNAWMLGRANLARKREAQMMAVANSSNVHDLAFSGVYASSLRACLREDEQGEALAARVLALSEKHRLPHMAAQSGCVLGLTRARLGRASEGIELIRRGIASLVEIGSRGIITAYLAYLAEAQECAGAIEDALETIEQALLANPEALVGRPEILRIRGELRLKTGQAQSAVGDFQESIKLARSMGAKSWELRTTMSLARLLASQGRREEARVMLREIYDWFTEGFDTADLKDAKELLEELSV
jgi:tetratricopeptide (TPR) repeat protein